MSRHSFTPQVAVQVGVNAAVIYQNLLFWIEKNEANNHNFKDGRYWTYNSVAAFAKLFPYFTEKQIRTAIDKLLDAGLIVKGNYSDDRYDRTAWYALNTPICLSGQVDRPGREDHAFAPKGKCNAPQGKSIENRYNPDKNPFSEGGAEETDFQEIWSAFPEDRRRGKPACLTHFQRAVVEGFSPEEIMNAVQAYARESEGFTRSKVCFSDNWFKQERWRVWVKAQRIERIADAACLEQQCERLATWVRERSALCRHITPMQTQELLSRGFGKADLERAGVKL